MTVQKLGKQSMQVSSPLLYTHYADSDIKMFWLRTSFPLNPFSAHSSMCKCNFNIAFIVILEYVAFNHETILFLPASLITCFLGTATTDKSIFYSANDYLGN